MLLDAARNDLASAVWGTFAEWDATVNSHRPDSELAYLNRHAGQSVRVSELLYRVTERAMSAARATDGLFDPVATVPTLVQDRDDDRSSRRLTPHRTTVRSNARSPMHAGDRSTVPPRDVAPVLNALWRFVRLDPETRHVRLPANARLDLDGIAKGMAVDAALELLTLLGVDCALVDAGGDLGVIGSPVEGDGFLIAVPTPSAVFYVSLRAGALATSGVVGERVPSPGRIAPAAAAALGTEALPSGHGAESGGPVALETAPPTRPDLRAVTVAADTCEQAKVAARTAFRMGRDGPDFLDRHGLSGLFALDDGGVLRTGRWPEDAAIARHEA